jgi:hypothetical protein
MPDESSVLSSSGMLHSSMHEQLLDATVCCSIYIMMSFRAAKWQLQNETHAFGVYNTNK